MSDLRLAEITGARLIEIVENVRRERGNGFGLIGYRLMNEDLRGLDLTGFSIFNCKFVNCNLDGALLCKGKLVDCKFTGGTMHAAQLTDAVITNTEFSSVTAKEICFDRSAITNLAIDHISGECVSFVDAHISYGSISQSTLDRARFTNSELTQVSLFYNNMSNCDLSGTVFRSSKIAKATMKWCTFAGTIFSNCTIVDGTCIERSNLSDVVFRSVEFERARIYSSLLRRCSFPDSKFSSGSTTSCSLEDCDLQGAVFRQDLSSTEIVGGKLEGIDAVNEYQPSRLPTGYRSVRLSKGSGSQIVGPRVSLSGKLIGDLDGLRVRMADVMDGSDFSKAHLTNVDMSKSSWRDVSFSDATMCFVNLSGANFSGANFTDLRIERRDKPLPLNKPDDRTLYELHSGIYLYPALYDNNTVWPDGFEPSDIMCRSEDLVEASKLNASFIDASTTSSEGLVFLPSPDPFCKFLYVYAAMPELFDIVGPFAVPTRAARVLEMALSLFAHSVRKDDSGNKFDSFRQRLELGAELIAEELTPHRVRATHEVSANPEESLCNLLNERLLQRRRSTQYAAKKTARKTAGQVT